MELKTFLFSAADVAGESNRRAGCIRSPRASCFSSDVGLMREPSLSCFRALGCRFQRSYVGFATGLPVFVVLMKLAFFCHPGTICFGSLEVGLLFVCPRVNEEPRHRSAKVLRARDLQVNPPGNIVCWGLQVVLPSSPVGCVSWNANSVLIFPARYKQRLFCVLVDALRDA